MILSEDEIIQNMLKSVGIVTETLYYHMKTNGLVFHVIM